MIKQKIVYCNNNEIKIRHITREAKDGHPWVVVHIFNHHRHPKLKKLEMVVAWCKTRDLARKVSKQTKKAMGIPL
jgi:hypothetical protein